MVERQTPEGGVGGSKPTSIVLSFSKTLYSPKVLVIPRKRLLCPDMTKKLLTGTLSLNKNLATHYAHISANVMADLCLC